MFKHKNDVLRASWFVRISLNFASSLRPCVFWEQLLYDCFTGDNGWPTWPRSRCAAIQHYLKKVPSEGEARGFVDFHGAKVGKLCCFHWADFNNQLQPPKRLESIHIKLRFHDWLFFHEIAYFFQDLNVSFHTNILCTIYLIVVCL